MIKLFIKLGAFFFHHGMLFFSKFLDVPNLMKVIEFLCTWKKKFESFIYNDAKLKNLNRIMQKYKKQSVHESLGVRTSYLP